MELVEVGHYDSINVEGALCDWQYLAEE